MRSIPYMSEFKKDKDKRLKSAKRLRALAIISLIGLTLTIYYTLTVINRVTPEQIIDNTIRANYKTCGHRTVYDYPDNPFVYVKGNKRVYLKEGGCK